MKLTREQIKEKLGAVQGPMMAMFAEQKKGQMLQGKPVSIKAGGKIWNCMAYGEGNGPAPVYFDLHGGGYTWGTVADGDAWCALVSRELGMRVYSLEYSLTPRAEYPDQLREVYEIISCVREHAGEFGIDPDRMYIGGRSAGGNLAAALCLFTKQQGAFSFRCQVLDHPWLDLCGRIPWEERYSGEGALSREVMEGLALGYASGAQLSHSLVSPLAASDEELKGLPPAVIQTCELDSLEPEGRFYAGRLRENGVPVTWRCAPGTLHGFTEADTPQAEEGRRWLLEALSAYVR